MFTNPLCILSSVPPPSPSRLHTHRRTTQALPLTLLRASLSSSLASRSPSFSSQVRPRMCIHMHDMYDARLPASRLQSCRARSRLQSLCALAQPPSLPMLCYCTGQASSTPSAALTASRPSQPSRPCRRMALPWPLPRRQWPCRRRQWPCRHRPYRSRSRGEPRRVRTAVGAAESSDRASCAQSTHTHTHPGGVRYPERTCVLGCFCVSPLQKKSRARFILQGGTRRAHSGPVLFVIWIDAGPVVLTLVGQNTC